jgi:hypothetical protein
MVDKQPEEENCDARGTDTSTETRYYTRHNTPCASASRRRITYTGGDLSSTTKIVQKIFKYRKLRRALEERPQLLDTDGA